MSAKYETFRMTWKEIKEATDKDPVVLIPLGSTEQQGPHTPTGDYRAAQAVAAAVAKRTGSLTIPTLPFGYSEYFRKFPGTITLSAETVLSVLLDIVESLHENGFNHILFCNGHGGNTPVVDRAARIIRREYGLLVPSLNLWNLITPDVKKEIYGDKDLSGHGGEPLTSMLMYLEPDDMRMDLLKETGRNETFRKVKIKGLNKGEIDGIEGFFYFDMDDISSDGVTIVLDTASAERGKLLFDKVVDKASTFVNGFKKINTLAAE